MLCRWLRVMDGLRAAGGLIRKGADAISTLNDFCYSTKRKFFHLGEVNSYLQKWQEAEESLFIGENSVDLSLTCFSLKHRISHR
jgi:hypothetical protein